MGALYKRLRHQIELLQAVIAEKDEELRKAQERNGRLRKKNRELREEVAHLEMLASGWRREAARLQEERDGSWEELVISLKD